MKDHHDFLPLAAPADPALAATLERLGNPAVVFPGEVFNAGQLRQPAACHAAMLALGYRAVAPRHGTRWRWYAGGSEFAARWAYLSATTTTDIGAAIDARGAAKVGRPSSVRVGRLGLGVGRLGPASDGRGNV